MSHQNARVLGALWSRLKDRPTARDVGFAQGLARGSPSALKGLAEIQADTRGKSVIEKQMAGITRAAGLAFAKKQHVVAAKPKFTTLSREVALGNITRQYGKALFRSQTGRRPRRKTRRVMPKRRRRR